MARFKSTKRTSPSAQVLFKFVPMSHMLLFHGLKQVTRLNKLRVNVKVLLKGIDTGDMKKLNRPYNQFKHPKLTGSS